ncbi:hypothetical protein [Paraburkholderia adhaesiva]|uniref:hypothetical protein n=1 Tax=Paraburkholderia adhaesiva TaxID=2883244 RepID=UPI001F183CC9|nr:hypothetical protein [Paraburkholderia adhaesiva]
MPSPYEQAYEFKKLTHINVKRAPTLQTVDFGARLTAIVAMVQPHFLSKTTGERAGIRGKFPLTVGDGFRIRSSTSAQTQTFYSVTCNVPLFPGALPLTPVLPGSASRSWHWARYRHSQ